MCDGHSTALLQLGAQGVHRHAVHDGHDDQGQVERDDRGRDDEGARLRATPFVVNRVIVVEHGEDEERSGNAEGEDPNDRDLGDRVALLLRVTVPERVLEGHEAVDGDHAQVADGGGGEEHVQTVPRHAQQLRHR